MWELDEGPLTGRQTALKVALIDSNVLQDGLSGFTGTEERIADFQCWLVRQVEHRVDLAMDNRPAPCEINWHHWTEWLCTFIAMSRRVHVEAATVFLSNLPPALVDGSDSSDDDDDDGDDFFEVDGSLEVDGPRAGKSKERRVAEAMTGPMIFPTPDETNDARKHRGLSYSDIMPMPITDEERALGDKLCTLAESKYDEEEIMKRGSSAEAEFLQLVVDATTSGDELTKLCKGYRRAIAVFRQRWWTTHERYAVPERIEHLRGLASGHLVDYTKFTAEYGVDVRTEAPKPKGMTNVRSHSSLEEHATEALLKVWEDFARCGAMFVSDAVSDLLEDVQCAPMSRVEKSDDEGFSTGDGRFVYDGRHGGAVSVNAKTPAAMHPPSAAPTHLALIVYLVWLMTMFPGIPVLCCKRDVKAAFKLIWYSVSDSNWFGVRFAASMVKAAAKAVTWTCFYALFLVLVFGWSDSPGEYGVFGWGVSQAHRSLGPSSVVQLPMLSFFNMCFVDDAAVFELDMYGRAEESCQAYDWSLFQMLGRSLNLKKLAVDGMLGASHTFWGVTYHLERAAEGVTRVWVELTRSKKQKAATMVRMPSSQPGIRRVLLNDHQRLTGNVQWWAVCAPALRGLLGCFYAMSASTDAIWLAPPGSPEEQEILWREYDDVKALLRLLVEMGIHDDTYFQSRIVDALDFYDIAHLPRGLDLKVRYIGTDANGHETGGLLSAIDFEAKTWTFARASEYAPAMLEKLGVAGARMEDDLIIFVTELLAVIALAAEHGPAWSGSVVASIIDNDNANIAINTRRSRNRYVRYLLLILTALEFKYKFRLVAYYVNTHSNWLLDGIGRFERFRDRSDDEVREMIQSELIDAHVPGLVFESLSTLLAFFTSGATVMRTFAIPDGSINGLASEFVLPSEEPDSSSSGGTGVPSGAERSMALAAGHVGLGEIAAGTGALSQSAEDRGVGIVFVMEWDRQKFKFLEALHPDAVHRCYDIMGNEYACWLFPGLQPRIVAGGPPCVFAARSGKQLGLCDPRSMVFTRGTGLVIRGVSGDHVGKVWFVIIENVGEVAVLDAGAALLEFLRDLYSLGFVLSPLPPGGFLDLQVLEAHLLGAWAVRSRVVIPLERRWIRRWLGAAEEIEYPKVIPARLSDILEPNEDVPLYLIMPGRFHPLPGTMPDERGVKIAGYYEYGAPTDPIVRGSLVRIKESKASWRVMTLRSSDVDLLKSDRRDPVYERRLPLDDITRNVRERVAVRSADGIGTTICRFGEPGAVGGPGHQLVFRPGLGVTMLTSRELWRMQGSSREVADARYDLFVDTNPTASYEDLAGAAGDAIAGPWADAVISRTVDRSVRLVIAAQRRLAAWARSLSSSGSGLEPSP
jgi:site-specific DNA-cytosine methylase